MCDTIFSLAGQFNLFILIIVCQISIGQFHFQVQCSQFQFHPSYKSTERYQTTHSLEYYLALHCLSTSRKRVLGLTLISLVYFLWGICKQCRPRPDAAERGV